MKIILLILALVAVALAAPADDNNEKKPVRERGNTEYDANLRFNWRGDGSWKSKIEGAFKPLTDALKALGLNGNLDSESDGKGGGDVSGHFRLAGGRRGNAGVDSSSQGSDANAAASSATASAAAPKSGRNGVVEAGQGLLGTIPAGVQQVPNLSGVRTSRNAPTLPTVG